MRYISSILFLLLNCTVLTKAQVEPADTSRLVMQILGKDSTAVRNEFRQLEKDIARGNRYDISSTYDKIGQHYAHHGHNTLPLKYFLLSVKYAETCGNKKRLAWAYSAIGTFYKGKAEVALAMKYDLLALDIFKGIGHKHGIGSIYNSLGDLYEGKRDYVNAHKNYFASLNILKEINRSETLTWPYFNIGEVYMYQERYDSARLYFDSSLAIQRAVKDKAGEAWIYNNLSKLLVRQKRYDEALVYGKDALRLTDSMQDPNGSTNAHRNLYTIYEAKGDYKTALLHYKKLSELTAGAFDAENTKKVVSLQMQYDFDKQQELEQLARDKKDIREKAFAFLLVLICAGAIVAFYFQRRSNKLKAELLEQKEKTLQQNEMMMKEIHHRVKNNLQVTGTLLDLQLASITDEKARTAISESITRLNAISLIHHQLYSKEQADAIEFSLFASELYVQLNKLFSKEDQLINLINKIPQILLDIDTAVPLGLIVNELITNSYKHAFAAVGGSITLSLDKNGGHYTLTYTDSGPGLPADIDSKERKSLGMMIIQSLAKQIGGSFVYTPATPIFMVRFRDAAEMRKTA